MPGRKKMSAAEKEASAAKRAATAAAKAQLLGLLTADVATNPKVWQKVSGQQRGAIKAAIEKAEKAEAQAEIKQLEKRIAELKDLAE